MKTNKKSAELQIPVFKQGDDLSSILTNYPDSLMEALVAF